MKLQQYLNAFGEPLRSEDVANLIRLLACRNKTARGLADTTPPPDVRLPPPPLLFGVGVGADHGMVGKKVLAYSSCTWAGGTMGLYSASTPRRRPCPLYRSLSGSVSHTYLFIALVHLAGL